MRYLHVSAIAVISTLILQWSTLSLIKLVVVFWNLRKFWYFYKVTRITSPKPCQLNSFLFYLRSNPLDNTKVNMVYWCIQRLNWAAPCALSTMQVQPIAALEMRNLLFTIQINPLSAIDLLLHSYKVTFLYKIRYLFHNLT